MYTEFKVSPGLEFAKQFFISAKKKPPEFFSHWHCTAINNNYSLFAHPLLSVATAMVRDVQLIALGSLIDTGSASLKNVEVLEKLAKSSTDFAALECLLHTIAGRYVLIANIKGELRIYHDACGLKPVFYSVCTNNELTIASQPALLDRLGVTQINPTLKQAFEKHPNFGSWPVNLIPYDHVHQVLPNHYLNFHSKQAIRYWPINDLETLPVSRAAEEMRHILTATVSGLTIRNECVMSLTGGYDSRLLLSCVDKQALENIEFFTVKARHIPLYDVSIPRKIARYKQGLRHSLIKNVPNHELAEKLSENVGGMFYDPGIPMVRSFAEFIGYRTYLSGLVSEISRCYYYPHGNYPENITAQWLAQKSGFFADPLTENAINDWLNDVPRDSNVNILDLFYWEHRLGVWAACGLSFSEALIDQVAPMNSREYMILGLKTSMDARLPPYALIQEIIRQNDPSLLRFAFNYDPKIAWLKKLPLPWRFKKAMGWLNR